MSYQGNAKAQELSNDSGFEDPRIIKDIIAGGEQAERIRRFLSLLAVCHTVVVEKDADASVSSSTPASGSSSAEAPGGGARSRESSRKFSVDDFDDNATAGESKGSNGENGAAAPPPPPRPVPQYNAESPDEGALVMAAAKLGFEYMVGESPLVKGEKTKR